MSVFIRSLQGPVYDADRDHHFKALVVNAHELKNLQVLYADSQLLWSGHDSNHESSLKSWVTTFCQRESFLEVGLIQTLVGPISMNINQFLVI